MMVAQNLTMILLKPEKKTMCVIADDCHLCNLQIQFMKQNLNISKQEKNLKTTMINCKLNQLRSYAMKDFSLQILKTKLKGFSYIVAYASTVSSLVSGWQNK